MRTTLLALVLAVAAHAAGIDAKVKNGYADSNGVKIHYASLGSGPLIVMIHGFPDFWYTWRDQMAALSDSYQCRGDRPARLQPERQAEGRRELQDAVAGRRRGGGDQVAGAR